MIANSTTQSSFEFDNLLPLWFSFAHLNSFNNFLQVLEEKQPETMIRYLIKTWTVESNEATEAVKHLQLVLRQCCKQVK